MQFPITSWKETALKLQIRRSFFGDNSNTLIERLARPDLKKTMHKDRKMQGLKKTVIAKSWLLLNKELGALDIIYILQHVER